MRLDKNKYGMKKNFIMFLCLITVLSLVVIFSIINTMIYRSVYYGYSEEAETWLNHAVKLTNDIYNNMIDTAQNIINSSLVSEELENLENYDISGIIHSYNLLDKYFDGFTGYGGSERIVMHLRGNYFPEGEYINRIERLKESPLWNELESSEIYESTWNYGEEYISVYRHLKYYDIDYGYLEISVPKREVMNNFDGINPGKYERIDIINKKSHELYSVGAEKEQHGFKLEAELIDGSTVIFSADKNYAMRTYFYYTGLIFLAFLLLAVLFYFAYKHIVGIIMRDLYDFIFNIQSGEEMLLNADLIEVDGDKDVMRIKAKFKELINKNNCMHHKIEEINREKARVELNFLQSCINPHLLYNSLSAIKWCIADKSDTEVSGIVDDMTDYYRAVLAGGEEFITVEKEISLVEQYVQIIKTAYSMDIKLTVDVEDTIKQYYVIKLLLQPIVENAVMHGVNGIENAEISVIGRSKDEDIVFEVIDNGYGMDAETLAAAMDKNVKKGFGLRNSVERIAVYYGSEYGISINSKVGEGTKVSLCVKAIKEKPDMKGRA